MNHSPKRLISPLFIVAIYLIAGGLWILFSDKALEYLFFNPDLIMRLQTVKGWFYVLFTGALLYGLLKAHDSSQKKYLAQLTKGQAALEESETRFRALVEQAADAIFIYDLDGRFTFANPQALKIMGYNQEEIRKLEVTDLDTSFQSRQQVRNFIKNLEKTRPIFLISKQKRKDKTVFPVELRISLIEIDGEKHVMAVARDITEKQRVEKEKNELEKQLRQAQKMEAVGTLAGGIAHDFNNILTAITGFSEIAFEAAQKGEAKPKEIQHVMEASDRAQKLVQQILTFSRKSEIDQKPINLNQVIKTSLAFIERTIPKMISIKLDLESNLNLINGDPNQIEQILLNLTSNAKDAMPDGGKILIKTENKILKPEYAQKYINAVLKDYVLITISDTGCGMDHETLQHVFDPFYTTKDIGQGTGLGLASVYGIVKNHNGYITCQSEPGVGSTFEIHLPILKTACLTKTQSKKNNDETLCGNEKILLVDDEKALRELGAELLQSKGYQVTTADTGEQALELYQKQDIIPDLVILDLGMPGMGGKKALEELISLNPQVKVLIASGYSIYGMEKKIIESKASGFIKKPFKKADLLSKIREILKS